jgi:hypothetical protein
MQTTKTFINNASVASCNLTLRGVKMLSLALVSALAGLSSLAASLNLTIQGNVEYSFFYRGNRIEKSIAPFEVNLRGCSWQMAVVPHDLHVPVVEVACDDEYLYRLTYVPNLGTALVRRSRIPHIESVPQAAPIWLTYASGCFFSSLSSDLIPPPVTSEVASGGPHLFNKTWLVRFRGEFHPAPLGTPKSLLCFDESGTNHLSGIPNPPPFNLTPFTNVMFEVLEYTNLFGQTLPLKSQLDVFSFRNPRGFGQPTLDHLSRMIVTATNMARLSPGSGKIPPRIPSEVSLVDQRFWETTNPIVIAYMSDRWLSENEAMRLPQFRAAFPGGAVVVRSRMWLLLLFAIIVAGPLLVYSKRMWPRRKP